MAGKRKEEGGSIDDADERAVKAMQKELDRDGRDDKEEDDDEDEIEVDLDDDEDDEDGPDEEEDRPSRRERRRARYEDMKRERDLAAKQLEIQERNAQAMAALVEEMRRERRPPPADPEKELESKLESIYAEHENLSAEYNRRARAGTLTAAEDADFKKRARQLEIKRVTTIRDHGQQRGPSQADIEMTVLRAKNSDVLSHPEASKEAKREYYRLLGEGEPDGPATFERSVAHARALLQRGGARSAPTRTSRARFTAPTRGGSGTAAARAESNGPTRVTMTPEFRKMADEFAPHIKDKKKRYQHWAKGPGRAHVLDVQKGRHAQED